MEVKNHLYNSLSNCYSFISKTAVSSHKNLQKISAYRYLNEKIQQLFLRIWSLSSSLTSSSKNLLSHAWSYLYPKGEGDEELTFSNLLYEQLVAPPQKEDTKALIEHPGEYLSTAIKYAYPLLYHVWIPLKVVQNSQGESLVSTFLSCDTIQGEMEFSFKQMIRFDRSHFSDEIDMTLYQGGVLLIGRAIQKIANGRSEEILKMALIVLSTLPPAQTALFEIPQVKQISDAVHHCRDRCTFYLKQPVKYFVKQALTAGSMQALNKTNRLERDLYALCLPSIDNLPLNGALKLVLADQMKSMLPDMRTMIDNASDKIAKEIVVDVYHKGISMIKACYAAKTLNRFATHHPYLAAFSLMAAGGPQQKTSELAIRTIGAALFVSTGSSFFALTFIQGTLTMKYLSDLHRKESQKQDPSKPQESTAAVLFANTMKKIHNLAFTSLPVLEESKPVEASPAVKEEEQEQSPTSLNIERALAQAASGVCTLVKDTATELSSAFQEEEPESLPPSATEQLWEHAIYGLSKLDTWVTGFKREFSDFSSVFEDK